MSSVASGSSRLGDIPTVGLVILAGVAFGASIGLGQYVFAAVPVALAAVALLSRGRLAPYGLLVASACSVVDVYAYPMVSFGLFGVPLGHIVLGICLLGSALFIARNGLGLEVIDRRDIVLVGVLGVLAFVGLLVAYSRGTDMKLALWGTKDVLFYLALVPATAALATIQGRKSAITLVVALALAAAILQVIQVAVGAGFPLFVAGGNTNLLTVDAATAFLRVRGPGLSLIYVVAGFAASAALWGPKGVRSRALVVLLICLPGLAVGLNRNMALGLTAGMIVAAIVARRRSRFVVVILVACVLAVVGVVALGDSAANPIVQRLASLTDYNGLVESTLSERFYENGMAGNALSKSPVLGVGWGSPYGARADMTQEAWGRLEPRAWIHNQYLEVWLRMGLAGLVCVVALLVRAVLAGAAWARRSGTDDAWLGLGIVVSTVAMGASATVGMYFTSVDSVVPLSGVLALAFVLRNTQARQLSRGNAQ